MFLNLPGGGVLMHGNQPYDPKKAHEYYIKNRKLKGRKKGSGKPIGSGIGRKRGNNYTVKRGNGKTVKLSAQQLAEQKAYAAYRVGQIKKKLAELNKELRIKMQEARESEAKAKKPDSAAEKAEKARESEKYRDKHQSEIESKAKKADAAQPASKKDSSDTVAGLKVQITDMKASLKDAVSKQRELATAKKNG